MYSSSAIFSTLSRCWGLLSNVFNAMLFCYRVPAICFPSVVTVAGNSTRWNPCAIHGAVPSSSRSSPLGKKWYYHCHKCLEFFKADNNAHFNYEIWSESGIQDIWSTEWILQLTIVKIKSTNSGPLALISGNIPPLVRLLQAYIEKGSKRIIETKKEVRIIILFCQDNKIQ